MSCRGEFAEVVFVDRHFVETAELGLAEFDKGCKMPMVGLDSAYRMGCFRFVAED